MAKDREVAAFVLNGVAGGRGPGNTLRRELLAPVLALVLACGGSNTPQDAGPNSPSPIDPPTAAGLSGSLGQAAAAVAGSSPQSALAAQVAALALALGVEASDVSLSASLLAGNPARAALTSGTSKAFGFQLQLLHLAGSSSPQVFSGVLLFQGVSDWVLVAGPSPGSPIPPALGLLASGGQLWSATGSQESAQLQTEGATCSGGLPAGVTSCKMATFSDAGFSITGASPASPGATGSKTASMASVSLGAGVSLVIDCDIGSLCPGSTPTATVYVTPSTFTLGPGGTQKFGATVVGTGVISNAVTWSVEESAGGTIDSSGLYTAPGATGTFHVRATSVAAPTSYGRATVTVSSSSGISVSISPAAPTTTVHGSIPFESTVTGSPDTAVTWSVEETGGGTITSLGDYTAPANPGIFHVRATSVADPTSYARATVTVTGVAVTVSAQPDTTDGVSNLDCVASGAGPFTYAWHGYRDDGDTTGLSFSAATAQAPTVTLTTTATVGSNFYVFCVVSSGGSPAGSGYTMITLTSGQTIPKVTVSPSMIAAGTTNVTLDASPSVNALSVNSWIVQYGQSVVPGSLEDYLKVSAASWSTVFSDSSPTGMTEDVSASKFAQAGIYRAQVTVTSSTDYSQVEGTYYFQVSP